MPRELLRFPRSFEARLAIGLFGLVAVLASFNLHGSSIGMYHRIFDGSVEDPDLIVGEPRGIRSDEWLRWTPLVVSQAQQGYPETNTALRDGVDLTVIYDVPHGGWTAFFEPQHMAFHLVRDPEFAFAFKWFGLLATSFYAATLFSRRIGRLGRTPALLVGALWALSPFLHWWYQSQAFLAAAYGMLALVVAVEALKATSRRTSALLGVAVGYLGAAALMLQYPPYLLSAAIPALVLLAAQLPGLRATLGTRLLVERLLLAALPAAIIVGAVGLGFIIDKSELIAAIGASEHPGGRSFASGEANWRSFGHLLSGNLAPEFLSDDQASNYFMNQSEAAGFLPLLPTLLIAGLVREFTRWRRKKPLHLEILVLTGLSIVMALWLFVPGITTPFRILLFDQIPINRFVFMLGLTQFMLLVALLSDAPGRPRSIAGATRTFRGLADRHWSLVLTTVGTAAIIVLANRLVIDAAPGFVSGRFVVIASTVAVAVGIGLALTGSPRVGLSCLVALSLISSATVNPLYRGLDTVIDTPLVDRIEEIAAREPNAAWAVMGDLVFENLAVQAGARSISGSTPSTQIDWWTSNFNDDPENDRIADRSAHFAFQPALEPGTRLELVQRNFVRVYLDPCDGFSARVNLGFVVSPQPLSFPCLELIETVAYAQTTFSIYRRV